jgi:twitching motility protein PilT
MNHPDARVYFEAILQECVRQGASDVHLSSDAAPCLRIRGAIQFLSNGQKSSVSETPALREIAAGILTPQQQEVFAREQALDLSYGLPCGTRFRVHFYRERGQIAIAVRQLERKIQSFETLGLPPQIQELADLPDGLVLMTGPTGSGKTTTLATQIHQINSHLRRHIVTIEDPIEYLHRSIQSLVHQRELHTDVPGFAQGVRAALREDPDVLLIGEMRDVETMRAAIAAAETGHLVFSTLHTGRAVGAVDRLIGAFPGSEQESIRQQISMVLRAVVAQRLLPHRLGIGRVPVVEILKVTPAVAHLIRTGRPQQIYAAMEAGQAVGMQTMEQALAKGIQQGTLDPKEARKWAHDPAILDAILSHGVAAGKS